MRAHASEYIHNYTLNSVSTLSPYFLVSVDQWFIVVALQFGVTFFLLLKILGCEDIEFRAQG